MYGICGNDYEEIDKALLPLVNFKTISPNTNNLFYEATCDKYFEASELDQKMILRYPETGMCIREQQRFMDGLIQNLLNRSEDEFEIVVITNSLFILSDIPSDNVRAFNIEEVTSPSGSYFCGNLYDILANLSPDTAIGKLSSNYASKLIDLANNYQDTGIAPDSKFVDYISDNLIKGYIRNKC